MSKTLVIILGPHAVGKMTVGQELAKITDLRLFHKESKRNLEWSEAEMRRTSGKYRLNSYDGENLPFENYLKIDNTAMSPEDAAKMIRNHFAIEGRKE